MRSKEARRYDGLLAQFPWGFRRTKENRRHLAALRERLEGEPLFVEFRHDSWLTPELEPSLKKHRIGFCAVDEPELPGLLPRIAPLTTEDAYIRFHGRNAATWYGGDRNLRYDYSYTREELSEWLKRIGELAEQAGGSTCSSTTATPARQRGAPSSCRICCASRGCCAHEVDGRAADQQMCAQDSAREDWRVPRTGPNRRFRLTANQRHAGLRPVPVAKREPELATPAQAIPFDPG